MSKVHLIDEPRSRLFLWSACGIGDVDDSLVTNDEKKVTCKNCLLVMAKKEKDNER